MTGFRNSYRDDLWLRAIDLAMHIVLAVTLPGRWWFQFLPDVVLPYLWLRGMVSNRFAPADSWLLQLHEFLHTRGDNLGNPVLLVIVLVLATNFHPALCGAWLAHLAVDSVTHDRRWL